MGVLPLTLDAKCASQNRPMASHRRSDRSVSPNALAAASNNCDGRASSECRTTERPEERSPGEDWETVFLEHLESFVI